METNKDRMRGVLVCKICHQNWEPGPRRVLDDSANINDEELTTLNVNECWECICYCACPCLAGELGTNHIAQLMLVLCQMWF